MENCLREMKKEIIGKLSQLERSCINHYILENYLIEQFYNGECEDEVKYNEIIDEIIKIIRSDLKFWIEDSEIYLQLTQDEQVSTLNDESQSESDMLIEFKRNLMEFKDNDKDKDKDKEKMIIDESEGSKFNKTLYAIYNYIHLNGDNWNCKEENIKEEENNEQSDRINIHNNNNIYLPIEQNCKFIFDFGLLRKIFIYIIKDCIISINSLDKIKIQNMLLFFALNNMIINDNNKNNPKINNILVNKRYKLRGKSKEENNVDEKEIEEQIKIINIQENINNIKKSNNVREFMKWTKISIISPYESISSSLFDLSFNLPLIYQSYLLLNNIILIAKYYVKYYKYNILTYISEEKVNINQMFLNFKNEVLTEDSDEIMKLYNYYIKNIESNVSIGILRIIERQMKIKDNREEMRKVCDLYMRDYYNTEETKAKRKYYEEFAGIEWSEEDIKNFKKACELYKNSFLPNNKIAKFMGKHIYVSHVKAIRNKIIKENRNEKKIIKKIKLNRMKRKRGTVWKKEDL